MRVLRATLLLLLLLACAPARAYEAPRVAVTLQDARLSVNARAVPLKEILIEISRLSGIQFFLEAALDAQAAREEITVTLKALPIEEGLRHLLRQKNFVLVYSPAGLTEARVYLEGKGEFRKLAVGTKRPPPNPRIAKQTSRPSEGAVAESDQIARFRSEALSNPDPAERSAALDRLAESADQALARETVLEVLERERNPEVLESALSVLQDQESVPLEPVLRFAAATRTPTLRLRALELLSEHGKGDPRVRELLSSLARNDRDEEVREHAQSLLEDLEP